MSNLINEIKKNIQEVYQQDTLPWVLEYNASRESLSVVQIIIETLKDMKKSEVKLNKLVHIISFDTLLDNPVTSLFIEESVNELKEFITTKQLPILMHMIRPSAINGYWANVIGRGFPSPSQNYKWCLDKLKMAPLNDFLDKVVEKHKEYVILAGIVDKELMIKDPLPNNRVKHNTIKNAYVFAPFINLKSEDAKQYLTSNQGPIKISQEELGQLPSSDTSYLLMNEEGKRSKLCEKEGSNCWLCTVTPNNTSLTPFINKGQKWLELLQKYRQWLLSIGENDAFRMRKRQNDSIYFSKVDFKDGKVIIPNKATREFTIIEEKIEGWIDNKSNVWQLFDTPSAEEDAKRYIIAKNINLENGSNPYILIKKANNEFFQLGLGPFTQKTREEILKRLLQLQKEVGNKATLIHEAELNAIKKIWFGFGVWNDVVSEIFHEVFNKDLNTISDDVILFSNADLRILEDICKKKGVKFGTMKEIFRAQKDHIGYENRVDAYKSLQKILNQEKLHIQERAEEDEN